MLYTILGALSSIFLTTTAYSGSTFTPARPPAIPLAVKSPYLSAWLPAGNNGEKAGHLPGQWPIFWTGQVLGWTGLIRVDEVVYTWMGNIKDFALANQTSFEYTATRSIFTFNVHDQVHFNVTFLSPVVPNNLTLQSHPFSFMEVEATYVAKNVHVQLYTDISGEWASGDPGAKIQWNYTKHHEGTMMFHKIWKQEQQVYTEIENRAEWGTIYYATRNTGTATYGSGPNDVIRGKFEKYGLMESTLDENFRAINDSWPVFALGHHLDYAGDPVKHVYAIGLCQDQVIQFLGDDDLVNLSPLYKAYWNDEDSLLAAVWEDYDAMKNHSTTLDEKIARDSKTIGGDDYALITTLATRQAFGATQLVVARDSPSMFMKEISSNGNTQTIDVIYPASPIFFYTNPEFVKMLLKPHFEMQEGGRYPNKYAMHDLGVHYPNATGHIDGEDQYMPIEECGNFLFMVLEYVQLTNAVDYITNHYKILTQWADFLVHNTLYPEHQQSTDDFAGKLTNQTNLALKGILGISAMSKLAELNNKTDDAIAYSYFAQNYFGKWRALAMDMSGYPPHAMLTYNNISSHGLLYNLYADQRLNLSLVPKEIYNSQSDFYFSLLQNAQQPYGIPLDTRNGSLTKADWEMFAAAIANKETRNSFVGKMAKWIKETKTRLPFSDAYRVDDGMHPDGVEFKARPVVGGVFAPIMVGIDYADIKKPPFSNSGNDGDKENDATKTKLKSYTMLFVCVTIVMAMLGM